MGGWVDVWIGVWVVSRRGEREESASRARAGDGEGEGGLRYWRPRACRAVRQGRIAATAAPPEGPMSLELRSKERRLRMEGEVVKVCVCWITTTRL